MPDFLEMFDTSGHVGSDGLSSIAFHDLEAFTQGYVEALFFTDTGPDHADDGLGPDCGFADLAPEALGKIIRDCAAFQATDAWRALGIEQLDDGSHDMPDDIAAGRDFLFTRNGHGSGFWDGDWPEPFATSLSEAARAAGPSDIYRGDDGKLHVI